MHIYIYLCILWYLGSHDQKASYKYLLYCGWSICWGTCSNNRRNCSKRQRRAWCCCRNDRLINCTCTDSCWRGRRSYDCSWYRWMLSYYRFCLDKGVDIYGRSCMVWIGYCDTYTIENRWHRVCGNRWQRSRLQRRLLLLPYTLNRNSISLHPLFIFLYFGWVNKNIFFAIS